MLISYVIKRILIAIPVLLLISFCVFMIIQLPPGSYIESEVDQMLREGTYDPEELRQLVIFALDLEWKSSYVIKQPGGSEPVPLSCPGPREVTSAAPLGPVAVRLGSTFKRVVPVSASEK